MLAKVQGAAAVVLAGGRSSRTAARDARLDIDQEVRGSEDVWLRLESYVERAIPIFLAAQETQRFQPRGLAAAIDLTRDLLRPSVVAAEPTFTEAVDGLSAGIIPPGMPAHWASTSCARNCCVPRPFVSRAIPRSTSRVTSTTPFPMMSPPARPTSSPPRPSARPDSPS